MGVEARQHTGGGAGLALDRLTVNPDIARRLPFSLACRYRALPVAEANGRITVAMADPGDPEARQAILAALGSSAYLVWSDPLIIDGLLAEVWPGETCHSLQVVVYPPAGPAADELLSYGQAIGELLKASVTRGEATREDAPGIRPVCDLAIVPALPGSVAGERGQMPNPAGVERLLHAALLAAAGRPRWPLKHVLLATNDDLLPAGDAALAWAVRLARASRAAITLLVVVPPIRQSGVESGLDAWLADDTTAGHQIRRAAGLLVDAGLQARLRLRQGSWPQEIGREMDDEEYDLVVLGGAWRAHDLEALLRQAPCPLLIAARPAGAPLPG